jgi:hypothetical protein
MKEIVLRTRIRDGAVIFVRLRESGSGSKSIPIAYQAIIQHEPGNHGSAHLRLRPLGQGRRKLNDQEVSVEDAARAL